MPDPHAGEHQAANARPFEAVGAARVIADQDLTPQLLERTVQEVIGSPEVWRSMARASAAMARPRAAFDVADRLRELAGSRA